VLIEFTAVNPRFAPPPRPSAGRKPSVLLVDDHRQVLEAVSAMLSADFDVVDVATDGSQAIDKASRLKPDVIVMDVEMPGVTGFQAIRALKQGGSPATPVVFLSMHGSDEVVSEAFRCGAHGYVLKQRIARDLVAALDQALRGRAFVPSLGALVTAGHDSHVVQRYGGEDPFLNGLAAAFDLALRRGDATCLIATTSVRDGVRDRLLARGWDVGGAVGHKRFVAIDVADAFKRFMRNGLPEPSLLAEIAAELDDYRRTESEGPTSRLTVAGNMVMMLSEAGNAAAAVATERLWNVLTHDLPFLTICGYASACFHDDSSAWADICGEHRALSHANDV
jgi:CheY-like chemotaxis protein